MAWADEWNAALRPGAPANFSFLCVKEHVTSAIYECHLSSERPMIITFRDERKPEKLVLTTIGAILGPGVRQFISPKVYSLVTPDHDGQELSVKIKSPIPVTVALLPSNLADQVYDKTVTLTDALDQTGCKERGVQSMSFNCTLCASRRRIGKMRSAQLQLMLENRFPRIWVPDAENRDLRQLLWHRHRLVQMRTRITRIDLSLSRSLSNDFELAAEPSCHSSQKQ